MTKLILDIATWRCGGEGSNRLGIGYTALLNADGFMCCLGQFSKQLNPEVTDKIMLGVGCVSTLGKNIPGLVEICEDSIAPYKDAILAERAMRINDNSSFSTSGRIKKLQDLFAEHEFIIELKNEHILNDSIN